MRAGVRKAIAAGAMRGSFNSRTQSELGDSSMKDLLRAGPLRKNFVWRDSRLPGDRSGAALHIAAARRMP